MDRRTLILAAVACAAAPARAQSVDGRSERLDRAGRLDLAAASAYSAARRGVSLVAMQGGRVIHEDYPNGGAASRGWELASGTKSFAGVMAAAAAQDGLLSWDEPAARTLGEWRNDERRRISIRHLLSLTSGMGGGPIGRPPAYGEAIAARAVAAPGEVFAYGPTPFQIFGEIMRRKLDGDPLDYLTRRVFAPLGVAPTHWRRGVDGNPQLPSGAGFTARDWARFGWFVMRDGEGRLDRDALAQCFIGTRANPGYGLSWWLLREGLVPPGRVQTVDVDPELERRFGPIHMAAGAGDQRLYLMGALDLVVARQASGILQSLRGRRSGPAWSDADFLRVLLG